MKKENDYPYSKIFSNPSRHTAAEVRVLREEFGYTIEDHKKAKKNNHFEYILWNELDIEGQKYTKKEFLKLPSLTKYKMEIWNNSNKKDKFTEDEIYKYTFLAKFKEKNMVCGTYLVN